MKFCVIKVKGQNHLGLKLNDGIIDLTQAALLYNEDAPISLEELIEDTQSGYKAIEGLLIHKLEIIDEHKVEFAPLLPNPEKLICVGLNYKKHQEETGMPKPVCPILFNKFNNAISAHQQIIKLNKNAYKYDYEAELVIIIGKDAKNVAYENALDYVFGYTIGNDLSARDLQLKTSQWLLGKSLDGFAPMGPYCVSAKDVNPDQLEIQCKVNNELRQSSHTSDMIFDCKTIVSFISEHITLRAGDVIFTGTPSGVMMGYPEDKQVWLKSGDVVEVSIESIGTLQNKLS